MRQLDAMMVVVAIAGTYASREGSIPSRVFRPDNDGNRRACAGE